MCSVNTMCIKLRLLSFVGSLRLLALEPRHGMMSFLATVWRLHWEPWAQACQWFLVWLHACAAHKMVTPMTCHALTRDGLQVEDLTLDCHEQPRWSSPCLFGQSCNHKTRDEPAEIHLMNKSIAPILDTTMRLSKLVLISPLQSWALSSWGRSCWYDTHIYIHIYIYADELVSSTHGPVI